MDEREGRDFTNTESPGEKRELPDSAESARAVIPVPLQLFPCLVTNHW